METEVILNDEERKWAGKIKEVYGVFGIPIGSLIGVIPGHGVTRFEFEVDSEAVFPKITK